MTTIIMTVIRARVRRGLSNDPKSENWVQIPTNYEIPWLVFKIQEVDRLEVLTGCILPQGTDAEEILIRPLLENKPRVESGLDTSNAQSNLSQQNNQQQLTRPDNEEASNHGNFLCEQAFKAGLYISDCIADDPMVVELAERLSGTIRQIFNFYRQSTYPKIQFEPQEVLSMPVRMLVRDNEKTCRIGRIQVELNTKALALLLSLWRYTLERKDTQLTLNSPNLKYNAGHIIGYRHSKIAKLNRELYRTWQISIVEPVETPDGRVTRLSTSNVFSMPKNVIFGLEYSSVVDRFVPSLCYMRFLSIFQVLSN
jgi:hypothetical protein